MVPITLFPMLYLLYFYISTFRSMCAVPSKVVSFFRSLISCFPVMFRYFLNDSQMVQIARIITGIVFVFAFYMRNISIVRSLCIRNLSSSFFITFLSHKLATYINIHVPLSLSRIMMSGL
jgi:hypothetical protein